MSRSDKHRPIGQLELWAPEPVRASQEEINLVEWPWAVLSDASPKDRRVLEFSDTIRTAGGKALARKWTVSAPANGSLPTATDEAVYLAIAEITRERGMVSDMVPFTRRELCQRLGWTSGGKDYKRLVDSLRRLAGVTIEADNAFWDKTGRVYRTIVFHIFDELAIGDGRAAGGELPLSHVRWSQVLFSSMQARYLKPVDLAFFLSLDSSLARRLFRYLDRKRHLNREFSIDLHKLAFEHMALARGYSMPEVRRVMGRAHAELKARGFLESAVFGAAVNGEPKVTYTFTHAGFRALPEPEARTEAAAPTPKPAPGGPIAEAEREANRQRLQGLDAIIEAHPEILEEAAALVESRPRPPKRGGKVWTGMVRDAAREIAADRA